MRSETGCNRDVDIGLGLARAPASIEQVRTLLTATAADGPRVGAAINSVFTCHRPQHLTLTLRRQKILYSTVDFVSKATEELKIPLTRTLLVKSSGNEHVVQIGQEELLTKYSSPQSLVQELLGFEHCLDPKWTAFGPHPIRMSEVFYESKHALGLVNLKPIVPGHVLIIPRRRIDRFIALDSDEVSDLWQSAQTVAKCLEPLTSYNVCYTKLLTGKRQKEYCWAYIDSL
ncbi:hypothetical protein THRCLA_00244 [Thraustotheca clavata]|uniref:HIT domain-containing protein n=1 Tax=Thraustotheca clavata TaxID=74557 RepID=A0A1W0AC33_9STRA|nr:hypothetical protein THRCLA_00244 [Thraustotheca clavata]